MPVSLAGHAHITMEPSVSDPHCFGFRICPGAKKQTHEKTNKLILVNSNDLIAQMHGKYGDV